MSPSFSICLEAGSELVSKTGAKCTYNGRTFHFPSGPINIGCIAKDAREGIGGFVGGKHQYFLFCSSGNPEIAGARFSKTKNRWENYMCLCIDKKHLGRFVGEIWTSHDSDVLYLKPLRTKEATEIFEKEFRSRVIKIRLRNCMFESVKKEEFLANRKENILAGDEDQLDDSDGDDSSEEETEAEENSCSEVTSEEELSDGSFESESSTGDHP